MATGRVLWRLWRLSSKQPARSIRNSDGFLAAASGKLLDRPSWCFILPRDYAKNPKKVEDEEEDDFVDPRSKPNAPKGPRLNRAITNRFIRLVSSEGHNVITREEALKLAESKGLDLVEVDPTSDPIVCKIMDYKLEKYKEKVREKERKKANVESRRLSELKELQITNKIDDRDLEMKAENASRLIQRGHRLKCVVKLPNKPTNDDAKGPVKADPKAMKLIEKLVDLLKDVSKLEQGPQADRHRAWAILRPLPSSNKQKTKPSKTPEKQAEEAKPPGKQAEDAKPPGKAEEAKPPANKTDEAKTAGKQAEARKSSGKPA